MIRRSTVCTILLALSLAFLPACSKGSEGESQEPAEADATPADAPEAGGQASTPSQPGQPGVPPAPSTPADTSKMPDVVARVNGQEIKKDELLRSAEMMRRMAASGGGQVPPLSEAFCKNVLESLIAQTLLMQDAARQGVTVSDEELKPQMEAMRRRFADQAAYEKALAEQGLTENALQEKLRQEAVTQKYVGTRLLKDVAVTDAAAKEFYDNNRAQMQRPEREHLRHILVKVDPGTSEAEKQKAKAKAEDLLKRVQAGEDFAKLAAENSDDPGSKARGGDLSWVVRGQTVPPFDQAAFALTKPNELSGVVESQFGYHIIQLVEKQAASPVPFEEAKGRITQMLKQRQAGETLKNHVEALKKQGKVEVFL